MRGETYIRYLRTEGRSDEGGDIHWVPKDRGEKYLRTEGRST